MEHDAENSGPILRVAALSVRHATPFRIEPGAQGRSDLADKLGLLGIRKLRFEGNVMADGATDWRLDGKLGATVVQACVVTLEPVTTRIDVPVTRRFVPWSDPAQGDPTAEIEMPEDDTLEPLGDTIDLPQILTEALTLALPDYPRADAAQLDQTTFAAEGVTPLDDADTRPFASLRALRDGMTEKDQE